MLCPCASSHSSSIRENRPQAKGTSHQHRSSSPATNPSPLSHVPKHSIYKLSLCSQFSLLWTLLCWCVSCQFEPSPRQMWAVQGSRLSLCSPVHSHSCAADARMGFLQQEERELPNVALESGVVSLGNTEMYFETGKYLKIYKTFPSKVVEQSTPASWHTWKCFISIFTRRPKTLNSGIPQGKYESPCFNIKSTPNFLASWGKKNNIHVSLQHTDNISYKDWHKDCNEAERRKAWEQWPLSHRSLSCC